MTIQDLQNYYSQACEYLQGVHFNSIERFIEFVEEQEEIVQRERLNEETTEYCSCTPRINRSFIDDNNFCTNCRKKVYLPW